MSRTDFSPQLCGRPITPGVLPGSWFAAKRLCYLMAQAVSMVGSFTPLFGIKPLEQKSEKESIQRLIRPHIFLLVLELVT